MTIKRTYYDVLSVSHDAPTEVISAAYRAILSKLRKHPDLGGDQCEAALINEAHEVLADSAKRARYDSQLNIRVTATHAAPAAEERRRALRINVDSVISYCIGHDFKWHSARVRDVSVLGIRLSSHEPLSSGQKLVIAPTNLAAAAMHGTVRWVRISHPTIFERVYEAGVEFPDQITDVEQRLRV